jgi:hypothetical protein
MSVETENSDPGLASPRYPEDLGVPATSLTPSYSRHLDVVDNSPLDEEAE